MPAIRVSTDSAKVSDTGNGLPKDFLLTSRQKPSKKERNIRTRWRLFCSDMFSDAVIL